MWFLRRRGTCLKCGRSVEQCTSQFISDPSAQIADASVGLWQMSLHNSVIVPAKLHGHLSISKSFFSWSNFLNFRVLKNTLLTFFLKSMHAKFLLHFFLFVCFLGGRCLFCFCHIFKWPVLLFKDLFHYLYLFFSYLNKFILLKIFISFLWLENQGLLP